MGGIYLCHRSGGKTEEKTADKGRMETAVEKEGFSYERVLVNDPGCVHRSWRMDGLLPGRM